ncbi:hypothetical protein H6P81_000090 [Aristolochia fimbriata]|uniref:Uncharacterized protein n=1 Tax=Aristolochia fimbriata TaxID=158543 RepID=A0AAV7F723_ARIFI|nr:hypothetical protein H6P81_000090 [Aristolochia fimbriata]
MCNHPSSKKKINVWVLFSPGVVKLSPMEREEGGEGGLREGKGGRRVSGREGEGGEGELTEGKGRVGGRRVKGREGGGGGVVSATAYLFYSSTHFLIHVKKKETRRGSPLGRNGHGEEFIQPDLHTPDQETSGCRIYTGCPSERFRHKRNRLSWISELAISGNPSLNSIVQSSLHLTRNSIKLKLTSKEFETQQKPIVLGTLFQSLLKISLHIDDMTQTNFTALVRYKMDVPPKHTGKTCLAWSGKTNF